MRSSPSRTACAIWPATIQWNEKHYPQIGDLSFFVGFTVTAVVYLVLEARAVRRRLVSP